MTGHGPEGAPGRVAEHFGEGGDDPYRRHLDAGGPGTLRLRRCHDSSEPGSSRVADRSWRLEVLHAPADPADRSAIRGVRGPLLDVGCGPGRMVDAARTQGMSALGLDVALEATRACAARGTRVLHGSVFDPVPDEGAWGTVLLLDGNVGIGGDPGALLARCAALLAPDGVLVVEADGDRLADERGWYVVVGDGGDTSAAFPWARLGHGPLLAALERSGLEPVETRTAGGRCFVHARRAA